uniref:Uncharacterized protein n=1 Tax=Molossus molossus TaxID=27622 RepID=A0A7J8DPT6_MOLMO|nr:hypothetical protein HJG59_009287 [Molossus molossus]
MWTPFPSVPVPLCPAQAARWGGGRAWEMRTRGLQASSRNPASVSPGSILCLPPAQGCPCAGMHHEHQGVFLWLPQTPRLAASLSPLCPSAIESSSTLLLQTEAASGFPSTTLLHSATAVCISWAAGVSVPSQAPLCLPKPRGLGCWRAVGSLVPHL